MRVLQTLLFLFAFLIGLISASCPPRTVNFPCKCMDFDDPILVECADISLEMLKAGLKLIPKGSPIELVLDDMHLGSVPSDFFSGFNIQKLEISHCDLDSLAGDGGKPLTGLEDTLEELNIISSFTEENEEAKLDLSHLRKLSELDLSYNFIDELGDDWFANGPSSLTRVIISNNGIEKVGDRAFANLSNLKSLSFDGNRFGGEIKRSMLPSPANSLRSLELDNNAFTSIPQDLFSNMPALKSLSLRTNGLRKVAEETFGPIWQQIKVLDFRGNPLECDSYIDWMKKLKSQATILGTCQAPHDKQGVDLNALISGS